MPDVHPVSPFDETWLAGWYAAYAAGARHERPYAMASSLAEMRTSLQDPSPVLRRLPFGAFDGDDCVGAMLLELPLQSDTQTAAVEIYVPAEHRRRGVGTALWDRAEAEATERGRHTFQVELGVPASHDEESWPGARFALARGLRVENVEDHLVVDLPYDHARLEALERSLPAGTSYRVEAWHGPCPEEYVEAWAALQTAMSVDVPTGGMTREPVVHTVERVRLTEQRLGRSWLALSALALTDAGDPVGYSQLLLPLTQPEHVLQDDTLVLRAHRGHALGSRLKIANLRRLAALPTELVESRRWLHTYTAQSNGAMQRVNAGFGFRVAERLLELER